MFELVSQHNLRSKRSLMVWYPAVRAEIYNNLDFVVQKMYVLIMNIMSETYIYK